LSIPLWLKRKLRFCSSEVLLRLLCHRVAHSLRRISRHSLLRRILRHSLRRVSRLWYKSLRSILLLLKRRSLLLLIWTCLKWELRLEILLSRRSVFRFGHSVICWLLLSLIRVLLWLKLLRYLRIVCRLLKLSWRNICILFVGLMWIIVLRRNKLATIVWRWRAWRRLIIKLLEMRS